MSLDELLVEAGAELDRLSQAHTAPHTNGLRDTTARRWAGAAAALALIGTVMGVFALVRQPDTSTSVSTVPTSPPTETPSTVTETSPAPTPTTAAPTTSTVVDAPALTHDLQRGSFGDDVAMMQQRLTDLGFFVGPVDGQFGEDLQQAVWAFKKLLLGMSATDLNLSEDATVVTQDVWARMAAPVTIEPRRSHLGSTHVEIYLPQQVLVVFADDVPVLVAHTSSGQLNEAGEPAEFCETATYDTDQNGQPLDPPVEQGVCSESKTPGGVFTVTRKYDGKRVSPLGGMYKPVYFNYGIAVHGAQNVPREPASHGAVRISNRAADAFFELVDLGDSVFVWGEDGRDPEQYTQSESLPSFNRPEV
jgi:hypothetical protein